MLKNVAQYTEKIENARFANCSDEKLLELLNSQLEYALNNSSFYHERLEGRLPLASISELKSLPFTAPHDIVSRGRDMICVSAGEIQRIVLYHGKGQLSGGAFPFKLPLNALHHGRVLQRVPMLDQKVNFHGIVNTCPG